MRDGNRLFCDVCKDEIVAIKEGEEDDFEGNGWSNWKTAQEHVCRECHHAKWEQLFKDRDPCGECRTEPCKRGRDCWWEPSFGTFFSYETYIADKITVKAREIAKNQTTLELIG